MLRVIVVDDHHLIRAGLRGTLSKIPGVTVINEGESGEQALELVRTDNPDIVFMDIRMPGIGGIEATRRILQAHDNVKVVIVTAFTDESMPNKLLKAGASAYITKNTGKDEIARTIDTIMRGEIYISSAIAQQMVVSGFKPGLETSPLAALSERELQIAQMITSGHRAGEVAAILSISPKTINAHKYRIYEKLGVTNDVELTLCAVKYGLVDPSEVV